MINWRPKGASGWNQLHLAASSGDTATITDLVDIAKKDAVDSKLQLSSKKESKLDIRIQSGDTALHIALRKGHAAAARMLVAAGCDVKALGARGETALHIVAGKGMIPELHWLVESFGIDIHATTRDGSTCVHMAAMEDRCDTLRALYALGAKMDVQNDAGETPLHYAAKSGSVGAVLWLIEKEPGLLRKLNKSNKDAEAVARDSGRTEAAAAIQEAKNMKKRVNKSVADFQKMLARGENTVAVKDWLGRLSEPEIGLLIDTPNNKTGSNAFLEACSGGDVDVCKYLYSAPGKRELINTKTGATALQIAASRGHLGVVQFLLDELEMDPSRADAKGMTPIQEAMKYGHVEIAKVLKENEEKRHLSIRPRTPFGNSSSTSLSNMSRPMTPERQQSETSELSSEHSTSHRSITLQRNLSGASTASGEPLPIDDDVVNLVKQASLPSSWTGKLAEQGWGTLQNLLLVLEADLTEMGMAKGHRRALLQQLDMIKEEKKNLQRLQSRHSSSTFVAGGPEPPPSPMENKQVTSVLSKLNGLSISEDLEQASDSLPTLRLHLKDVQRADIPHDIAENTQVELVVPSPNPRLPVLVFILTRKGNVYSCSCGAWKYQPNVPLEARTCEHLKIFRGEHIEALRVEVGSKEIVSKNLGQRSSSGIKTQRALSQRSLSMSWADSAETATTTAGGTSTTGLSETSRKALNEIRRVRSEQQLPDVPAHFIVKWEELRIEQVIGQGSFGIVRLGSWRGMRVAVKELKLGTSIVQREEAIDLKREANTMARVCNHDNVVPLVGMVLQPTPSVVMTFMPGGSVEDLLVLSGKKSIRHKIPWYAVLKMIRDAAAGVLHLHRQGVIHRDLSARNLLVDATGAVRVADFGFARIKDENLSNGYTASQVGPIKWMAPEALRSKKFSERSDVFAFGVTMWEILAGQRPWPDHDLMDVVFRVCNGERMELPSCPNVQISLLVGRCWAHAERERPTMQEVLEEVDAAWHRAGGNLATDPSGGVVSFIQSEAFQIPSASNPAEDHTQLMGSSSTLTLHQPDKGSSRDRFDGVRGDEPRFVLSSEAAAATHGHSDEKIERDHYYDDFDDD